MTAVDRIREALERQGYSPLQQGNAIRARCPAHDGGDRNLALYSRHEKAGLTCHSHQCEDVEVLEALGLGVADLFDNRRGATYPYRATTGEIEALVTRRPDPAKRKTKTFTQQVKVKGSRILYNLDKVIHAVKSGETIYLVEGEEDVHTLARHGVTATTARQGGGNAGKADFTPLSGATVVAVVDKDPTGEKWATAVAEQLEKVGATVTLKQAAVGKDVTDHIDAGRTLDDLLDYEVEEALPARRLRLTWASEIEPEPVTWAWQDDHGGRIPAGTLVLAAGREGTGKSSFGIWMAAEITKGTLPGAYYGDPRPVFYVAVEDSWRHTLVPRLMAAGADMSKVARVDMLDELDQEITLSLPVDNNLLEREAKRVGAALIVVDPLMSAIGGGIDTHREREVRTALDPLAKMADRCGAIVLGIAHFNKGSGSDPSSLITGSGAFKNVARAIFGFAKDENSEDGARIITQTKNSLGHEGLPSLEYAIESATIQTRRGPAETGRLVWRGTSDRTVGELLRESRHDAEEVSDRREASVWLEEYLAQAGGIAPAKEIYAAGQEVGFSRDVLKRAKGRRVRSVKGGMRGGWDWTLVDAEPPREHEESEESNPQKPAPFAPFAAPFGRDDRQLCPDCGDRHLAGRRELDAGQCTQCQNVAAFNARVGGAA